MTDTIPFELGYIVAGLGLITGFILSSLLWSLGVPMKEAGPAEIAVLGFLLAAAPAIAVIMIELELREGGR